MKIKRKTGITKVFALLLAALLLCSTIPVSLLLNVFAAGVDEFTVTLKSNSQTVQLDNVDVTMTLAGTPETTQTVKTESGVATFKNFVEDETDYYISVSGATGYEDVENSNLTVGEGDTSAIVNLTAIEKITISGKVLNEKGNPYNNATVTYSGYTSGSVKTNAQGKYRFDAYKGKDYTVTASGTENYDSKNVSVTNPTTDYECGDLTLTIKEFLVDTTAGENGTITDDDTVQYGNSKTVVATANDGYCIDEFAVNGVAVSEAKGEKEFSKELTDIKEVQEVSVTFIRKTYTIAFTISENGQVTYNDGQQAVDGGSVSFNESTDPSNPTKVTVTATPNTNYRVSKVKVDDEQEQTFTDNDKPFSKDFKMTKDHTFAVEFSLNRYKVIIDNSVGGTASFEEKSTVIEKTVDYGSNVDLFVLCDELYLLTDISTTHSLSIEKAEGKYILENICEDNNVSFKYSVKSESNDKSVIITTKDKSPIVNVNGINYVKENTTVLISPNTELGYYYVGYTWNQNKTSDWTESKSSGASLEKTINSKGNNYISRVEAAKTYGWYEPDFESPWNYKVIYDNKAPEVYDLTNSGKWFNTAATYSFKVKDDKSGVSHVLYSDENDISKATELQANNGVYSFIVKEESNKSYYIWVEDACNNISQTATEVSVKIDTKAPTVTAFTFSTSNTSVVQDIIHFLSFGTLCKQKMYVTVVTNDETISSSVSEITLKYGDSVLATKQTDTGTAVFELTKDKFKTGADISAIAKDKAGNESLVTKPTDVGVASNTVKIDDTKPTVTTKYDAADYTDASSNKWYDGNVDFSVTVKDANTGIKSVSIKLNGKELTTDLNGKVINADFSSSFTGEEEFKVSTSQGAVDGKNVLEVVVTNNAGVESEKKTETVYIDTTNPDIIEFNIKKANDGVLAKVLNFLTFGTFFNEEVKIEVTAKDNNATSGVKSITLFADGVEFETKNISDNKCTFVVPIGEITNSAKLFDKQISAKATDNVGNVTAATVMPTTENSNVKSSKLMIETVAPTIEKATLSATPNSDVNENTFNKDNQEWFTKDTDVNFTVNISDADSGIKSVEIKINGTSLSTDTNGKSISKDYDAEASKTTTDSFVVSTSQVSRKQDTGSFTLEVKVCDNAGNVTEMEPKTIYKDTEAPIITEFDFEPADGQQSSAKKEDGSWVESTTYGFYFKADTKVTVRAKDDTPSSGVNNIYVYLKDATTNKYIAINGNTNKEADLDNTYNTAADAVDYSDLTKYKVTADNTISFTIPAHFKGQIFAKASDNAGNKADNFVTPDDAIVENAAKHSEESHIQFSVDPENKLEKYKTNDDLDLYSENVPVKLTVTDTYSGIREIEWSVVAPYDTDNNQSGKISVRNDKTTEGDSGWSQDKTDSNLVTVMSKTITVNNNSNNIVVHIKMTDRAGNTSEDEIKLSIDKSAPIATVTMNDDDNDKNVGFFNVNRKATIEIKERNFVNGGVKYIVDITDDNGVKKAVPISAENFKYVKTEVDDANDIEYYVYSMSYVFDNDGDYTFAIEVTDLSANKTTDSKVSYINEDNEDIRDISNKFTVDKTKPVVTVTYDNNNVLNGNYYKADRTATITIAEHNFDAADVKIIGEATDKTSGTEVKTTFPTASEWKNNGNNTYTATIHYADDSKYTFDIEFIDKAGNSIDDYGVETFFVDKTAPTLEINGVGDKTANSGPVAPEIKLFDTNFNKDAVTLSLVGANRGKADYSRSVSDIINGQTIKYADFERVQVVDDIYTLSVKLVDMAGNESTKTITFSVNRFGSIYALSDAAKGLNEKYVKTPIDVVITETNTDALSNIKFTLFKNDKTLSLKENDDYKVEVSGGNGQWYCYTYTVFAKNFADDGVYRLTVHSEDAAGNVAENTLDTKNTNIQFGVDSTNPTITVTNLDNGITYALENMTVKMSLNDNLLLNEIKVYLDDYSKVYKTWNADEIAEVLSSNSEFTFDVSGDSTKAHKVKVVCIDAAGNESEKEITNFYVTTNLWVRYYNNKALFFGSIGGVIVLAGLIIFLVLAKRKKKEA